MLKSKQIVIIGGDERYFEIIALLSENNAKIDLIGYQDIEFNYNTIEQHKLTTLNLSTVDAIILPVGGCSDTGEVSLNFPNDKVILTKEIIEGTKDSCVIYAGTANNHLQNLATETGRKLTTLFTRDDVAIANSIPTAEAALEIAMAHTDFTIHDSNVLITGFGRVGITTARLFHQVGANVTVTARKDADFARISEMRLIPLHHNELTNTNHIDIYINTVPALLFTEDVIQSMKQTAIIIDLASAPGGTDFDTAEKNDITAILALALPGKVAPKTAGKIIANTLLNLLTN